MCLSAVSLNLKWNEKFKTYVGEGYKNINEGNLSRYGRIGRWTKASGSIYDKKDLLHTRWETAHKNNEKYHPGYHIFLDYNDAYGYSRPDYTRVYKVLFKNVICFGTNKTWNRDDDGDIIGAAIIKPCVIAQYIKLIEVVTKD